MQNRFGTAVLLLLALSLSSAAGCRVLGGVDVSVVAWEADLRPEPGAPGGIAAALSQGESVQASIQISGGAPEAAAVYRWRIRTGSCSNPGSVIGGLAQYPDLDHEPPASTTANAVLRVGMPAGHSYHVVLLRASDEVEIACGQFTQI